MEFPDYKFASMGETDVREEIVAPLLRHLGYRSSTINDIVREQNLKYPNLQLGRRKPTDPPLRGKADYICIAGGLVKWVIEAKAPGESLDELVVEQAWSYAMHPQIAAVYFVLTNGHEFRFYQTNRGADAKPFFQCSHAELQDKLTAIENLLSPAAVLRDHPAHRIDTGKPIGPGLRSIVRVTSGRIHYSKLSAPVPLLQEMIMTVTNGSVERAEDGSLTAHLWSLVPFQSLQKLNEQLGLDQMKLTSTSTAVSSDPLLPTVFEGLSRSILPKGIVILNLLDGTNTEMPMNMTTIARTRAVGYLKDSTFSGDFFASITYVEAGHELTLEGLFDLQLA